MSRDAPGHPPSRHPLPRAARLAVSGNFLLNGIGLASWAPRIPEVKNAVDLSTGTLGLALLSISVGAFAGTFLAGALVSRWGSRRVTVASGLLLGATLGLPGLAPTGLLLAGALACAGFADGAHDVAMNAHGVVVERRYERSILSGLHAVWSVGAGVGGLIGALAAAAGVPVAVHLAAAGVVVMIGAASSAPWLLPAGADRSPMKRPTLTMPNRTVLLLALVALAVALIEGAPADWSAVYLSETLSASPGVAGAGYAAFAFAMVAGRLGGDRFLLRYGPSTAVRWGGWVSAAGMSAGLLVAHPAATIAGLALVGVGVAVVFPAIFSAAGNLPDVPAGSAISTVAMVSRGGFLLGPPLIGFTAEATSLRLGLGIVVVAALAMAGLSGVLSHERPSARSTAG